MWLLETLDCPWLQKLIFGGEEERWKIQRRTWEGEGRRKCKTHISYTLFLNICGCPIKLLRNIRKATRWRTQVSSFNSIALAIFLSIEKIHLW